MSGRTLTDSLYLPPKLSAFTNIVPNVPAFRRYSFLTVPTLQQLVPPYITRTRRMLAFDVPIVLNVGVTKGHYEQEVPEEFIFSILSGGRSLIDTSVQLVSQQNQKTEMQQFYWSGTASASLQNPIDISHTTQLEFVCRGQLPSFTVEYNGNIQIGYNYLAVGPQEQTELVPGRGSLLYDEDDVQR